ncbi:MAG: sensor histidine kinase YesM [Cyclobacteriaceae bacterium]|jgi:sensor histidine kinase YesM
MFVQPFVENAMEHGNASIKDGKIELRFMKDRGNISIDVSDNGPGLTQRKDEQHTSLSLTINKERIDLFVAELRER